MKFLRVLLRHLKRWDKIKVRRLRLRAEYLLEVDKNERIFFLSAGLLANELSSLHKMHLWSARFPQATRVQQSGQIAFSLFALRLLAGKLNEGWRLLHQSFFGGQGLSKIYEPLLPPDSLDALKSLKSHFNNRSLLEDLRNNFAFHYSPTKLDEALSCYGTQEDLDIFLGEGFANSLYYTSEVLMNLAMADAIGEQDPEKGFERIVQEVVEVSGWFLKFLDGCLLVFLRRHGNDVLVRSEQHDYRLHGLSRFDDQEIPWFTRNTGTDSARQ